MKLFFDEVGSDQEKVESLITRAPDLSADYEKLDHAQLESKLIEVHNLQIQVDSLQHKYEVWLASDDREQEQTRADSRAAAQGRH